MKKKKLFIVDAMAMAFRNFHAFGQNQLKNSKGQPTSAVYGSAQFLIKLIKKEKPDYLIIASDSKEKTFRHNLYPEYKANRTAMPEDLASQIPYLYRLFSALKCPLLVQPGVEADDLIGSLVKKFSAPELDIYIVSGDKDFMQLVNKQVKIYTPKKEQEPQIVGDKEVEDRFGCKPSQVVDILSLIGDSADNVPGVVGIGEKGAVKLLQQFHSLDNIFTHLDEIKNPRLKESLAHQKDQAYLSRQLVTIDCAIPLPHDLDYYAHTPELHGKNSELLDLFREMEFRSLIKSLQDTDSTIPNSETKPYQPDLNLEAASQNHEGPSPVFVSINNLQNPKAPTHYQIITDQKSFFEFLKEVNESKQLIFDTETTGLSCVEDSPIGISFSLKPFKAYYLPLEKKHLDNLDLELIIKELSSVFARPNLLKIGHNLKFDLQMLANFAIEVKAPFADTMLMSYLISPNERQHGLDLSCLKYLNYEKIPTSSLIGKGKYANMPLVPLSLVGEYACEDADLTGQLYEHLLPILASHGQSTVFSAIEMPLVPILAQIEQNGVYIDTRELEAISTEFHQRLVAIENDIFQLSGHKFNINSPLQLQKILFEELKIHEVLGIKKLKKTKSGFSTDVTVLESLAAHPLAKALLEYRSLTKLKSTYVDTLPQLVSARTGRIHTHFHQTGTATGRLSSSDPNLQNIPIRSQEGKRIRQVFSAGIVGWKIISADYSQIELRLLAHLSDDEGLIKAFKANEDIHTATAVKIFGPSAAGDKELRARAKAINFGIVYGMGSSRLAKETGVSLKDAKEFIHRYFSSYPGIKRFIDEAQNAARNLGYSTTITGRRRPIPEINSRNAMELTSALNVAINSPIQGSAADLIKIAMINVDKILQDKNFQTKMLLQVHDELVFHAPEEEIQQISVIIKKTMEEVFTLKVPLLVEIGVGSNWLEAH